MQTDEGIERARRIEAKMVQDDLQHRVPDTEATAPCARSAEQDRCHAGAILRYRVRGRRMRH